MCFIIDTLSNFLLVLPLVTILNNVTNQNEFLLQISIIVYSIIMYRTTYMYELLYNIHHHLESIFSFLSLFWEKCSSPVIQIGITFEWMRFSAISFSQ